MSLQAIVLAGGLGSRLRSVVHDRPKVMAEVAGRPFLEYILIGLERAGFGRVVLAVGYRKAAISKYFGRAFGDLDLVYSEEQKLLGTGGGIHRALRYTEPEPCFVLNGDTWVELHYQDMLSVHRTAGALLTIAVRRVQEMGRFGAVEICQGHVHGFLEKGRVGPGFVNAGVYLLSPEVFSGFDLPEVFSLEQDFLAPHLMRLNPPAFQVTGGFIDIGIPEDYRRAHQVLAGHARLRLQG
jgi:D-glycero-alpha-D-manno-heptose 1-phosphate guanylyltransferase